MPSSSPRAPLPAAPASVAATLLALVLLAACGPSADAPAPPAAAPARAVADTSADTTGRGAAERPPAPDPVVADGDTVALPPATVERLVAQDTLWARALRLHYDALVLDGHIDTPMLMADDGYDLGQRHAASQSHLDLPRMHAGGLDGAFFAAYVAPYYGEGARAVRRARTMIETIRTQISRYDDQAAFARTAADVVRIAKEGRAAVLLGLEGGHALAASPDTLAMLAGLGVRYVTLTHINTNRWADSSQDAPAHDGLTDEGRAFVRQMNRLGVVVDVSHVSDSTFYDALDASRVPVIASHSSMRAKTAGPRNLTDAQVRALADRGGVVMINFFDAMVNRHIDADVMAEARRRIEAGGGRLSRLWSVVYAIRRERGLPGATLADVLNHLDHAVQVAGIDHVALGSDFDGVFDLPAGLEDVTRLPWITHGLLARGYAEADVRKILGGNTLRVLRAAERYAAEAPDDRSD